MRGQAHPGGAVLAAAASPLGPRWCDTRKAQAAFSSGSPSAAPAPFHVSRSSLSSFISIFFLSPNPSHFLVLDGIALN